MALLGKSSAQRHGASPPTSATHRTGRIIACLAVTCLWCFKCPAADAPTEYEVKAAFLYKFVGYVEWPRAAIDDAEYFDVGILGDSPFDAALGPIFSDKRLLDRPVRIRTGISMEEAMTCHLLFVADSELERAEAIAQALASLPVLTVGDDPAFADAGLIMAFEMVDSRVRFVVNANAADASPLRVSSRLMEVARVVRPESKP